MTVSVVTGAGRGIGRAIAERLLRDGRDVIVTDIDAELAWRTGKELGCLAVECDVTDPASVAACAEQVGAVDLLVNNAGIVRPGSLLELSIADYRTVMDVNVLGTLLMVQALAPALKQSRGAVVNVASMSATLPVPGTGVYSASKAAVVSLTSSLALELGADGVRVNAVAPGRISTEMMTASSQSSPEREARTAALIPSGRVGEPSDVADVVAFLASSDARYVKGQVVYVDGGLALGTIRYFQTAQGAH